MSATLSERAVAVGSPAEGVRFEEFLRRKDLLLMAIGNDCRGDDGLGWAFGEEVERATRQGSLSCRVEYRYQLQVDDAAVLRDTRAVLFIDASATPLAQGFRLRACEAAVGASYTTHELSPQHVLGLCRVLYGRLPDAWLLELQGVDFTLGQPLTRTAEGRLFNALRRFGLDCARASGSCNKNEILTI